MTVLGAWARVCVDDARALIYGPNLGRLYLVTRDQASDRHLQSVLGLRRYVFHDTLDDPALRIVHDLANLKTVPLPYPSALLRLGYRLIQFLRHLVPFRVAIALIDRLAAYSRRRIVGDSEMPTVSDIGRLVHAIERAIGIADCYPRALITCFLALRCGHHCKLTIGSLVPTRKMHAWCSIDGQLPYEALPEHYLYQPLLVLALSP